ncbi:DUF4145 domain-containing protein [Paenibacillus taichungensis]|uniref:DUF4145 domain-containing protein n=1 Tax=Paenibacillus taichungensis TaxID=484184 RepID=UPI0038D06500
MSAKVYCRECKRETNHGIHKKHVVTNQEDFFWRNTYYIAYCLGCEGITFVEEYEDEDMQGFDEFGEHEWYSVIKSYPEKPVLEKNENIWTKKEFSRVPEDLLDLYNQVVDARNQQMLLLSAVGLRLLVEAICINEGVKDGHHLNDDGTLKLNKNERPTKSKDLLGKINGLFENGIITLKQSKTLHQIRELGNQIAHEVVLPKRRIVTQGIEVIEIIFFTIYDMETFTISPKQRPVQI